MSDNELYLDTFQVSWDMMSRPSIIKSKVEKMKMLVIIVHETGGSCKLAEFITLGPATDEKHLIIDLGVMFWSRQPTYVYIQVSAK